MSPDDIEFLLVGVIFSLMVFAALLPPVGSSVLMAPVLHRRLKKEKTNE